MNLDEGLSSKDIERCLRSRCETRAHFIGVFSLDKLPKFKIDKRPGLIVCNTAYHRSRGEHWVAIYLDNGGGVTFFDSYALPPGSSYLLDFIHLNSFNGGWHMNTVPLQSLYSAVCGHYATLFLFFSMLGLSLSRIVELFRGRGTSPDSQARVMFRKIFGHKRRSQKCVGTFQKSYKYLN